MEENKLNTNNAREGEGAAGQNDASSGELGPGGGRERLKRHREEAAKEVVIPEKWGKEQLMKEWIEYTTFDALFAPHRLIVAARDALIADARKAKSQRLRLHNSC